MDKTAIKNFAIWARNKLKSDIKVRAGFMGITESGIASPLPASTSDIQYFDVASSEPVKLQEEKLRCEGVLCLNWNSTPKNPDIRSPMIA